ncbi:MAG TPA: winged helix-turn-helix domain-containing protein [Pyrinomonadaceae bacterium]|nr:winged helix-turn-helix domain-containing protein [Pyrinomonadaceae bacterium]
MKVSKTEHPTQFYAFDSFLVDAGKSVLLREGQSVPLTPKAFEILLVLVRNPGRVLKKEELLEEVWPDAFVEENNLPRNISSLRKALGEGPAEHKYIVTLPGQGYRFVATVNELETPDRVPSLPTLDTVLTSSPQPNQTPISSQIAAKSRTAEAPPRRLGLLIGSIVLVLTLASSVYFAFQRWSHSSQPMPPQRKLWQLTFEPGLETDPSWSPDGHFVAYSSDQSGNFDIWVRSVGEGNSIQVTSSQSHDWQPNWSPDGLSLVFRSEREGGGLFVVPALGGNERKLCGFGYRPRWSPDGSQVLFYGSAFPGVVKSKTYVISASGGTPREVLNDFVPQFISPLLVAWHPDSNRLSVWGNHRQSGWSFWTVPLTGGPPLQSKMDSSVESQLKEAAVSFANFLWLPSGKGLIIEGESQGVRNLWKVKVEPQTLRWIDGLERLTTGAGKDTDITISSDGRKLAFSIRSERSRLWTLPFDPVAGGITGTAQPLTVAGMDALQPGLSPDGKMLVFRKRRADKEELWAKSLGDGRETLLTGADDFRRVNPILSHDGLQLIYIRSNASSRGQAEIDPQVNRALTLRTLSGSDEQIVTSALQGRLSLTDWTTDGKLILISSDLLTPGRVALCLLSLDAAPHAETQMRVIASNPEYNLWQGRFSPDGRWISFNAFNATDPSASTVYVVSASGGPWVSLTEGRYWDDKPRWSPDGNAIYFVSNRTGFFNVWKVRFDPASGKPLDQPRRVTDFETPTQMIISNIVQLEMALTSDRLILPMMETSGGIWVLENVDR